MKTKFVVSWVIIILFLQSIIFVSANKISRCDLWNAKCKEDANRIDLVSAASKSTSDDPNKYTDEGEKPADENQDTNGQNQNEQVVNEKELDNNEIKNAVVDETNNTNEVNMFDDNIYSDYPNSVIRLNNGGLKVDASIELENLAYGITQLRAYHPDKGYVNIDASINKKVKNYFTKNNEKDDKDGTDSLKITANKGKQCFAFAYSVFNQLFPNAKTTTVRIKVNTAAVVEAASKKWLPGDILSSGGDGHTMVVYKVTATSVWIYDANNDKAGGIGLREYLFEDLAKYLSKYANGYNNGYMLHVFASNYERDFGSPTLEIIGNDVILVGYTTQLKANNMNPYFDYGTLSWSSSDTSKATVDKNGKVNAISPGVVNITLKTSQGSKVFQIIVSSPSATINGKKNIIKGSTYGFTYTLDWVSTKYKATATWSSEDTSIATVDKNGGVIGVKHGTTNIVLKVNGYTFKYKVNVYDTSQFDVAADKTTLDKPFLWIFKDTTKIKFIAYGILPVDSKVTYSSSNSNVITVDKNGKVTAQGKGKAIVTVVWIVADGVTVQKDINFTVK